MRYLKCIIANRATLTGMVIVLSCLFLWIGVGVSFIKLTVPIFYGMLFLWPTMGGGANTTYATYTRVTRIIATKGIEEVRDVHPKFYCARVGYNLALDEAIRNLKFNGGTL